MAHFPESRILGNYADSLRTDSLQGMLIAPNRQLGRASLSPLEQSVQADLLPRRHRRKEFSVKLSLPEPPRP